MSFLAHSAPGALRIVIKFQFLQVFKKMKQQFTVLKCKTFPLHSYTHSGCSAASHNKISCNVSGSEK